MNSHRADLYPIYNGLVCPFAENINGLYVIETFVMKDLQKQPPRGVTRKSYSENLQQVYRRTPMCDCALQLY